jgi:hypothetical protein
MSSKPNVLQKMVCINEFSIITLWGALKLCNIVTNLLAWGDIMKNKISTCIGRWHTQDTYTKPEEALQQLDDALKNVRHHIAFGAPATSTNSGLFGSTTGFGGFGSTSNTNSSPFGANKPAFGTTTTTNILFGAGTSTGFGSTTNAFCATGTALGECQGTVAVPFSPYIEKEPSSTNNQHFQSIVLQIPYQKFSPEELRFADYAQGRRYGNASETSTTPQSPIEFENNSQNSDSSTPVALSEVTGNVSRQKKP